MLSNNAHLEYNRVRFKGSLPCDLHTYVNVSGFSHLDFETSPASTGGGLVRDHFTINSATDVRSWHG